MKCGIYLITNLITGMQYVGQSRYISRRWVQHCCSHETLVDKDIDFFGKENFSFEILEECSIEQLSQEEAKYIAFYDTVFPKGYNIMEYSGTNYTSYPFYPKETWETVKRMLQEGYSAQEIAKETKLNLSSVYYFNRGEIHKEDGITYPIRKDLVTIPAVKFCKVCGKPISSETKTQMCEECYKKSIRTVERPDRDALLKLIYEKGIEATGKQFGVTSSSITKWCISYNLPSHKKELVELYEKENNISKKEIIHPHAPICKVAQYDLKGNLIKVYNSISQAKVELKIKGGGHISQACNGKRKTYLGFIWKYVD